MDTINHLIDLWDTQTSDPRIIEALKAAVLAITDHTGSCHYHLTKIRTILEGDSD